MKPPLGPFEGWDREIWTNLGFIRFNRLSVHGTYAYTAYGMDTMTITVTPTARLRGDRYRSILASLLQYV